MILEQQFPGRLKFWSSNKIPGSFKFLILEHNHDPRTTIPGSFDWKQQFPGLWQMSNHDPRTTKSTNNHDPQQQSWSSSIFDWKQQSWSSNNNSRVYDKCPIMILEQKSKVKAGRMRLRTVIVRSVNRVTASWPCCCLYWWLSSRYKIFQTPVITTYACINIKKYKCLWMNVLKYPIF